MWLLRVLYWMLVRGWMVWCKVQRCVSWLHGQRVVVGELGLLTRHTPSLRKLPCHLALVLDEAETHCMKELCSVVAWTAEAGIPRVSLYDLNGVLHDRASILTNALTQLAKGQGWTPVVSTTAPPTTPDGEDKKVKDVAPRWPSGVGGDTSRRLHVHILSTADARTDIVRATLLLSQRVSEGTLKADQITETHVQDTLRVLANAPDPDALFTFGSSGVSGFHPWRLHRAEIFQLGSLEQVSRSDFWEGLSRFAGTTQRCGR